MTGRHILAGLCLGLLVFVSAAPPAGATGRVTTVQPPPGLVVTEAVLRDLTGDGLSDLILAARSEEEAGKRVLIVYRRLEKVGSGPCFGTEPDTVLTLTRDAVAFAVADVSSDEGNEVVLFSGRGAFAWRPRAGNEKPYVRLLPIEFLWQIPDRRGVFEWTAGVPDLDGDGLPDLLVPEPSGFRIAVQQRDREGKVTFDPVSRLEVPDDPEIRIGSRSDAPFRSSGGNGNFTLSFDMGSRDEEKPPLVSVQEKAPAPRLLDWDADGDLDVLAQTTRRLHVWLQDGKGRFSSTPDLGLPSPVIVDRERRLDFSYSGHALDLDRDRRADSVIMAGDKRSKDVRTQVLVFLQDASRKESLFGPRGVPGQLLVLDGFAGRPRFGDVDGDGFPDLTVVCLRPDLIDRIRSATAESLEGELTVFRNSRGAFSRRPDLTHRIRLVPGEDNRLVRFFGDVTGDGVSELLIREKSEELKVYLTRRRRDELTVFDRPLFELTIPDRSRVIVVPDPLEQKVRPQLLVLDEDQVLHVRFP